MFSAHFQIMPKFDNMVLSDLVKMACTLFIVSLKHYQIIGTTA